MTDAGQIAPAGQVARPGWAERRIAKVPAILIGVPVAVSLLVWLAPPHRSGLTGFVERAPISWPGLLLVAAWLACAALVASFALGRAAARGPLRPLGEVSVREFQFAACVLGAIGAGSVYWSVTGGSVAGLVALWNENEFYRFSQDFDYGTGVSTFRYAAVLAGGLTIARLLGGERPRLLDGASLLVMIAAGLLSARIIVVMSLVVAMTVLAFSARRPRVRVAAIVAGALVLLAFFVVATFSRNASYYEERAAIRNPAVATLVEMQAYLATPAQVTVLGSGAVMDSRALPSTAPAAALGPVLPPVIVERVGTVNSFDSGADTLTARYQGTVGFTTAYTTNGAAIDLLMIFGWWALPAALVWLGVVMWAAGRLVVSGPIGAAIAGALLYGLAETWRVWLYHDGLMFFMLLVGLAAVVVGLLRERERTPVPAPVLAASGPAPRA